MPEPDDLDALVDAAADKERDLTMATSAVVRALEASDGDVRAVQRVGDGVMLDVKFPGLSKPLGMVFILRERPDA